MKKKEDISKSFEALNRESLIIKKMLSGKISPEEKAFFEDEIENDPFLREALEGLNQFKSKAKASEAITKASEKISERTGYQPDLFKGKKLNVSLITAVAASALILVVAIWAMVKTPAFNNNLPPSGQVAENLDEGLFKRKEKSLPEVLQEDSIHSELQSDSVNTPILLDSLQEIAEVEGELADVEANELEDPAIEKIDEDGSFIPATTENSKVPVGDALDDDLDAYSNPVSGKEGAVKDLETKKVQEPIQREEVETVADSYTQTRSANNTTSTQSGASANSSATYVGGNTAMRNYISQKARYPSKLEEALSGSVRIEATIDEKGRVKNSKILSSLHPLCDKEALRVVKGMPRWEPAKSGGKAVEQKVIIEVPFSKP